MADPGTTPATSAPSNTAVADFDDARGSAPHADDDRKTERAAPSHSTTNSPNTINDDETPIVRRATGGHGTESSRLPAAERATTAPTNQSRPAAVKARTTAFLGGAKRRVTGEGVNDGGAYPAGLGMPEEGHARDSLDSSSSESEGGRTKGQEGEGEKVGAGEGKRKDKGIHPLSGFSLGDEFLKTRGRLSKNDGRLRISMNQAKDGGFGAKFMGKAVRNHFEVPVPRKEKQRKLKPESDKKKAKNEEKAKQAEKKREADLVAALHPTISRPKMNIVIMVIGSRGDIQPFLRIGQILKHTHGHRVRIASHPTFREFVEKDSGLEFFSVGGDPSELMAFMVKNPGLIPSMQTVKEGEVQRRRAAMAEMFDGMWRACVHATDAEDTNASDKLLGDNGQGPFIADALIANPPSMAHVHIAEKLGVPLHMMFTMPYSPTTAFPHPLANIKPRKSNVDANYLNFASYPLVEMMTWQGLGDIVNRFREETLGLEPVSALWAPGALYRMKVPYTYIWSPSLVSKPPDWGQEIDIAGFVFMEMASNFQPPQDLADFLAASETPPVYIGFGSIVVDDPDQFTSMIFRAAELAGVRVLVNKGWGGLGSENIPDHVYMLGNTPHDWLFPRVSAVVHHGGAGTTAIGLKCGKPTMIVPFFGDQPFWGARVAEAGAGPTEVIPYKRLTAERLADGIKQCLTPEANEAVAKIAASIAHEGDGAENAVNSFHASLPLTGRRSMRCSILQERVAVWRVKRSALRLSALAAELLREKGLIQWTDLELERHYEWNDFEGPGEPLTGLGGALTDSLFDIGQGFGKAPMRIARHLQTHERHIKEHHDAQQKRITTPQQRQAPAPPLRAATQDDSLRDYTLVQTLAPPTLAILTLPNALHLALARGLHNAPRLWNDPTVRKPTRITNLATGTLAARREFAHSLADAFTGLYVLPAHEWNVAGERGRGVGGKLGSAAGKGVGKGVAGLVVKVVGGVVSPLAFVVAGGVRALEVQVNGGDGNEVLVRRGRVLEGRRVADELKRADEEDRARREGGGAGDEKARLGDDEKGGRITDTPESFEDVQARVFAGFGVFEEIWAEAHRWFDPRGANLLGKWRYEREKRVWSGEGALDDADKAREALKRWRDERGKDGERGRERVRVEK